MTLSLAGPLLLIGAGKMGGALLEGWLRQGLDPKSIFIQDPEASATVEALAASHGIAIGVAPDLPGEPSVVVIAVKPQVMDKLLPEVEPLLGEKSVVLSIAAGRTIAGLAHHLPPDTAIVRAMPNTPAAVGHGISVAVANERVTPQQKSECDVLLASVGEVIWIDDEMLLDAVTAVSGSGPAYVFLLVESLAEAGVEAGLDPELAGRLACATISGAGELLRRSELSPLELRENVTSPQGTTAAALEELMVEKGLKHLLRRAVAAAAKRSKEMSS